MDEIENALLGVKAKKRSIMADKVTRDNIYKALIYFEDFYDKMDESERREFMTVLLDNVQIYEEDRLKAKEYEKQAEENAKKYIEEKYGIKAKVTESQYTTEGFLGYKLSHNVDVRMKYAVTERTDITENSLWINWYVEKNNSKINEVVFEKR